MLKKIIYRRKEITGSYLIHRAQQKPKEWDKTEYLNLVFRLVSSDARIDTVWACSQKNLICFKFVPFGKYSVSASVPPWAPLEGMYWKNRILASSFISSIEINTRMNKQTNYAHYVMPLLLQDDSFSIRWHSNQLFSLYSTKHSSPELPDIISSLPQWMQDETCLFINRVLNRPLGVHFRELGLRATRQNRMWTAQEYQNHVIALLSADHRVFFCHETQSFRSVF